MISMQKSGYIIGNAGDCADIGSGTGSSTGGTGTVDPGTGGGTSSPIVKNTAQINQGVIRAARNVTIVTGELLNQRADILAVQDILIFGPKSGGGTLYNDAATIRALGNVIVSIDGDLFNTGTMEAGGVLNISANTIFNGGGGLGAPPNGSIPVSIPVSIGFEGFGVSSILDDLGINPGDFTPDPTIVPNPDTTNIGTTSIDIVGTANIETDFAGSFGTSPEAELSRGNGPPGALPEVGGTAVRSPFVQEAQIPSIGSSIGSVNQTGGLFDALITRLGDAVAPAKRPAENSAPTPVARPHPVDQTSTDFTPNQQFALELEGFGINAVENGPGLARLTAREFGGEITPSAVNPNNPYSTSDLLSLTANPKLAGDFIVPEPNKVPEVPVSKVLGGDFDALDVNTDIGGVDTNGITAPLPNDINGANNTLPNVQPFLDLIASLNTDEIGTAQLVDTADPGLLAAIGALTDRQLAALEGESFDAGLRAALEEEELRRQYEGYVQNGVNLANQFALTPGQRPSPAQLASLDTPVILMIDNGTGTLEAQLFMPTNSGNGGGALDTVRKVPGAFIANDIYLTARGTLTSTGAIAAQNDVSIAAGSIAINTALGANYSAVSGTDIRMVTAGDLIIEGADISALNDLTLAAGGNIVAGVTKEIVENSVSRKRYSLNTYSRVNQVTDLTAGGEISVTAGGSAMFLGTNIAAGNGVDINAQGDAVFAAVQNIQSFNEYNKKKGFLSSKTTTIHRLDIENIGVNIDAGAGGINVVSQTGDLITAGTEFNSQGDINLSAVLGDIFAGTYTDVHENSRAVVKKSFGGLFGGTSSSSVVDKINTGTNALAALDLSLVSGGDLTLVGANLSAGGGLNINVGGDFNILGAIDTHKEDHFESNNGLVLSTTMTENIDKQTAQRSRFTSGSGLSVLVGGAATLTTYGYENTAGENTAASYPPEILAITGLNTVHETLIDEYFFKETTALSPAFKILANLAMSAIMPANLFSSLGKIGQAAARSFVSSAGLGVVDAAVSGDFDLGAILKTSAFSAFTSGLTTGVNLSELGLGGVNFLGNDIIAGFGSKLTYGAVLDGVLDSALGSGASSIIYGSDFWDGFKNGVINNTVDLVSAAFQHEIGDLAANNTFGVNEGNVVHAALHGIIGCATAEAAGESCAAGAAAGAVQALYAGTQGGLGRTSGAINTEIAGLLGGLAAVIAGGDIDDFYTGQKIAQSGFENNYLTHVQRRQMEAELAALRERCDGTNCPNLHALVEGIMDKYAGISAKQTSAFLAICQAGAVATCGKMLSDFNEFYAEAENSIGVMGTIVEAIRGFPNMGTYNTLNQFTARAGVRNLDNLVRDEYSNILGALTTGRDGQSVLNLSKTDLQTMALASNDSIRKTLVRDNATIRLAVDGVALAAGFGCGYVSAGATAAACYGAAITGGALLLDDAAAAAMTIYYGEEQTTFLTGRLMATGMTETEAQNVLFLIGSGAAVVSVVGGVKALTVRGTKNQIRNLEGLSDETVDALGASSKTAGSLADDVPLGYTRQVDGSITGPGGGRATQTGLTNADV